MGARASGRRQIAEKRALLRKVGELLPDMPRRRELDGGDATSTAELRPNATGWTPRSAMRWR